MPKRRRTPESILLKDVCDYLTLRRVWWIRINTGCLPTPSGRPVRFGTPGASDLILCLGGTFVAVEVKSTKGRQTDSQKGWAQTVIDAGGRYWLVRSVEDVAQHLAAAGYR